MQFPIHETFILHHNPQKTRNWTVKRLMERDKWDANVWVSVEEKEKAIANDDVWIAIWIHEGETFFLAASSIAAIEKELKDYETAKTELVIEKLIPAQMPPPTGFDNIPGGDTN